MYVSCIQWHKILTQNEKFVKDTHKILKVKTELLNGEISVSTLSSKSR